MLERPNLATLAISVAEFAIGGAVSRYNLRMTETRWQIAAFAGLAAGMEMMIRSSGHRRASAIRGALNAAVAAIVIVSVKFHLEPAARKQDSAVVRAVAKTVVNAAADRQSPDISATAEGLGQAGR